MISEKKPLPASPDASESDLPKDSDLPTYGELHGQGTSSANGSRYTHPRMPSATRSVPVTPSTLPARCTNHLSHHVRGSEKITGTYRINPQLCLPGSTAHQDHNSRKKHRSGKIKIGSGSHAVTADKDLAQPMACFSSKNGDITIDASIVSVTSPAAEVPPVDRRLQTKASVEVRTRSGDIGLNLFEIEQGLHLSLDIETRQGDITLFVPRSFRGPMNITSKKPRATITFLPALSQHIQVIRTTKHEALIMMGDTPGAGGSQANSAPLTDPTRMIQDWDGDYAQISSRSGNIVIGIFGQDQKSTSMSFWQKLSQLPNMLRQYSGSMHPSAEQPRRAASDAVYPNK